MDAAKSPDVKAKHRQRARKWSKIALVAILVYMIYPITVTVALSTGLVEKFLASEDLRVEIDTPAWSLLPGDIHMARVRIFMNGDTQFILAADNLTAQVRILPLFRRRFEVASLTAKNVSYQMRTQLEESRARSPRTRAFPPLPGLPGDPTLSRQAAAATEERTPSWTVALYGIDVKVRELWFMEYRYQGDGTLKGGFERGPNILRVDTSVQGLGPGQLTFGAEQIISKNFAGQVEAEIPELDPSKHADTSFFEYVVARIHLHADIETLAHLSAYIPREPTVTGGAGPLDVRVGMQKGILSPETRISFGTPDVGLKGPGFGVKTDFQLAIRVGQEGKPGSEPLLPHLKSSAQVTYVSLAAPGRDAFTIQIQGHEEQATLNSARIGSDTELESARIHLPKIVTNDLDDLGGLMGKSGSTETRAGKAEASLTLNLDEKRRLSGPFRAEIDGIAVKLPQLTAATDATAKFDLTLDPAHDRGSISDLAIAVRRGQFRAGSDRVDNWWLNLGSERIELEGLPADHVRADVTIFARDAEPVIRALAEDGKVPGFVADIVHLRNMKVLAKVRKRQDTLDVMLDTLESNFIDFSGRFVRGPEQVRLALLVGGKTVALGIDKRGQHTGFQAFAGTDWLNERLRHFPKPAERVRGDKP